MQVGSLVLQTGMLGVIVDNHLTLWLVHWNTGNYSWVEERQLEVICK